MSMGFYVNLEMPKDCPMCPFARYDMFNTFCGCDITRGKRWAVKNDKDYAESSTRPDWCPLIEVPEPHGGLIDASEKIRVQMYDDEHEDFHMEEMTIDDLLGQGWIDAEVSTIIPASEEG